MNNKNKLLLILSIVFLFEVVVCSGYLTLKKEDTDKKFNLEYEKIRYKYEKRLAGLKNEMEIKKYQATGNNNYERIYNIQDQSIAELVKNIAAEAIPSNWKVDIKVEEFFNFILIIEIPLETKEINIRKNYKYLVPVIKWVRPYLQNIAIFNKYHQCIYYFDEELISQIKEHKNINDRIIEQAASFGNTFTLYNSVAIPFKRRQGHIFLPVIIYGDNGLLNESLMLDTGATTTMITKEFAQKTFNEGDSDQSKIKIEEFSTANGIIQCPVVRRNIVLGEFDTNIDVAVSMEVEINVLGMNYFSDKNYLIDSTTETLYLWKE